jgi:hypothetical protein
MDQFRRLLVIGRSEVMTETQLLPLEVGVCLGTARSG